MLALAIEFSRSVRKRSPNGAEVHGPRARTLSTEQCAPPDPSGRPRSTPSRVVLADGIEVTGELASGSTSAQATSPRNRSRGCSPPPSALPVLLRKEVIQPHLPVRLPCYDFVPIADPTFDGSLPEGLGHRLRVLLTFVT